MNCFERLIKVFNNVFEGEIATENITASSNLREDIGMNSIGMLYMAMAVEEEFGIKFTNDDFVGINTVDDVIRCIEGKL
ncbi:MAG: acyl carrier protein [Clostridia bacterium]|nr:acyl carrier protein [Clostridia bacterium]